MRIGERYRKLRCSIALGGIALLCANTFGYAYAQPAVENPASPEESGEKPAQVLTVDYSHSTGEFRGGATGTLYGLGSGGAPTEAILDGARVENSAQKPVYGRQHPSGDPLVMEKEFFNNGGAELVIYMQDYYPDWAYNGGRRPEDTRSYVLDVPVDDPRYGTYQDQPNGRWDYDEVIELVMNQLLSQTQYPDRYTFLPFNEPDAGNWYASDDNAEAPIFAHVFLADWDKAFQTIQRVWQQYRNHEKPNIYQAYPHQKHARIAGPGDATWRSHRTDAFLAHTVNHGTVPAVFVWHELGRDSLRGYQAHYQEYRALEKKHNVGPLAINITEYGELRDMGTPGQLIQWQSMFEQTKVQAETAFWNYAGNLSDNMARANSPNSGWWQFAWYGDLRGQYTVAVTVPYPSTTDTLQAIAAFDEKNRKATVLYGGATQAPNSAEVANTGANIPIAIELKGLAAVGLDTKVDVEIRENAFTGPDAVANPPRVIYAESGVDASSGSITIKTTSVDRYASYQLLVTPHQDRELLTDSARGQENHVIEAEHLALAGGARSYEKPPQAGGWDFFMTSGNADVGSFKTGSTASWTVHIDTPGRYRLQVISGNTGVPGVNTLTLDGAAAGVVSYGAELAMKGSAKWLYRGDGWADLSLPAGEHTLVLHGDDNFDNTLDKLFLSYLGPLDSPRTEHTIYPASIMRLTENAALNYAEPTRGFADISAGAAHAFVLAWECGMHEVEITYYAISGSHLDVKLNDVAIADIPVRESGLQSTTLRLGLAEGINKISLTGNGIRLRDVQTWRAQAGNVVAVEAEDLQLSGGAHVVTDSRSNAVGQRYVVGLGNQFETQESGPAGFGDPTRVVVRDSRNTPSVRTDQPGTLTIPAGVVPAGRYHVAIRFSNDAFIGRHDYNPQVVDLGLQLRCGERECGRGAFRYTYSDLNFMNRSVMVETDEHPITVGNWDPAGTGAGAVSWGVAPNIDRLVFYPAVDGQPITRMLLPDNPPQPAPEPNPNQPGGSHVPVAPNQPANPGHTVPPVNPSPTHPGSTPDGSVNAPHFTGAHSPTLAAMPHTGASTIGLGISAAMFIALGSCLAYWGTRQPRHRIAQERV
ncbi:hypothetical protein [Trueperella sp. LYQ141]|uniref:hypothetical protein n=1 Tax=Trueperella sp. LYQ141 TaxID=3391058 RepID=UPI003983014C